MLLTLSTMALVLAAESPASADLRVRRRPDLPRRLVTLVDRHTTYDHLDPLSARPANNAFLKTVIPFLRRAR
jgi:hypothetical protein